MQANHNGFMRVAASAPRVRVGDIEYNVERIADLAKKASLNGVQIIVFPELCLTGYAMGDLFQQRLVLEGSLTGLKAIANQSKNINLIILAGFPFSTEGKLFNVAAVIYKGKALGLVPKTYIPGYKEFYEERWFSSARDLIGKEVVLFDKKIPIGADLLFRNTKNPNEILGIEICEDLWGPIPLSSMQSLHGATIIANLSASNEVVGKSDYRRSLVSQQSARCFCGYIYTSCGMFESTADVVFGGHCMIAENGSILIESKRFSLDDELIISEIDIEHLLLDRERTTSFGETIHEAPERRFRFIDLVFPSFKNNALVRHIDPHPFIPQDNETRDRRVEEIFSIQTSGLIKRLHHSGIKKIILGLSGGLDSTLALLVAARAFDLMGMSRKDIYAFTMPGFATSKRTKSNAIKLAEALGVAIEIIDITDGSIQHLKDIGHDTETQDVTFQNVQARYRTMLLMNKANQLKGLVLGTSDLSEIALGWCTFSGDHISHYNVNASVPKTLVKYLVDWVSNQKEFAKAKKTLRDILDTPISPELSINKNEKMQNTEKLIGPYELHDFFLYHFARWESSPSKILFLAQKAFGNKYKPETIKKWLKVFITRFFQNQWKRSVMPDGPKVGSVALSPRGDWRMPSDAELTLWINDIASRLSTDKDE